MLHDLPFNGGGSFIREDVVAHCWYAGPRLAPGFLHMPIQCADSRPIAKYVKMLLGRFAPIFYFICKNFYSKKIHRGSPC